MRAVVTLCVGAAFCLPARADPLVYDDFSGPVANASGQFPTIGAFPWSCTGPGAANCVRGGGALTAGTTGSTIYYVMHTPTTPLQISYQFTDAVEAPAFVIAVMRDGSLNNMWHANGYNNGSSFVFAQTYWCDSSAGCPSSQANILPQSIGASSGPCPATVANRTYLGRLNLYGNTAVATLQDATTGNVLCFNSASDPALQNAVGPNFFLETYYASPNVVFKSVQADASPIRLLTPQVQSAPANTKAIASAIDIRLLGNSKSFDSIFNLSPPQMSEALAQLSGEIASMSAGVGTSLSTAFMDMILNPLNTTAPATRQTSGLPAYAARHRDASLKKFDAWISAYGGQDSRGADPVLGAPAEVQRQAGLAIGLDYRPTSSVSIGGVVGQARLTWSLVDPASTGHADATQGGAYLSMQVPQGYANMGFTYSAFAMSTQRTVEIGGPNQYKADFDGTDMNARFEVGDRILGRNKGYALVSFAAIDLQRFTTPSYDETTVRGGPSYALSIKGQDKNQSFTDLGLKIESGAVNRDGLDFRASLAWRHVLSPSQSANASFLADSAASFTIFGTPLDSDAAVTSVAGDLRLSQSLYIGAVFSGAFGGNGSRYGASATLRQSW